MTIQQIRYVIKIAETGSMNRAARMLGIRQPTVSKALAELEHELGIVIFERAPHGMTLTEEGREFLDGASLLAKYFGQLEVRYGVHACYQGNLSSALD